MQSTIRTACLVLFGVSLAACATGGRGTADAGATARDPSSADAAALADAEQGESPALPDAAAPFDASVLGPDRCELRVVSQPRVECRDACDARLLLVSGEYYCTFQCASTEECAPHGAALECVVEIGGVCVPRCERDEDCPGGFFRCDPVGRFCDTYPVDG
ncbi:MAG: hypothetical protein KF729_13910 [Sandaracinaceae bacterium]|nr:hypothetical protein [Sandaracinaceae bacterium]